MMCIYLLLKYHLLTVCWCFASIGCFRENLRLQSNSARHREGCSHRWRNN